MKPIDAIERYKGVCGDYFIEKGLEVHVDVSISDEIRWRPHLFLRNKSKIIVEILDTERISELQLSKYVDIMNKLQNVSICVVLIPGTRYLPELFSDCNKYGLGVYVIKGNIPTQILPSRPREVTRLVEEDQLAIMPGSPFGNILSFKKCLRRFRVHVKWFETNLPKKSLEVLYDGIRDGDLKGIESINLLRGVDDKLTTSFRDAFKDFRREVFSSNIEAEMRVILDRTVTSKVHGRFLYSVDEKGTEIKIQLPPLNSLRGDQWDTIYTDVKVIPSFDEYWKKANDILDDWALIEGAVAKHLQFKVKEAKKLVESTQSQA